MLALGHLLLLLLLLVPCDYNAGRGVYYFAGSFFAYAMASALGD